MYVLPHNFTKGTGFSENLKAPSAQSRSAKHVSPYSEPATITETTGTNLTSSEYNRYDSPNSLPDIDSINNANKSTEHGVDKSDPTQKSIVFNYSSIQLTTDMDSLLNKGLNFCILPLKLDMTQVFTDFRKFERSMIWHEFWFGREEVTNKEEPIFFKQKTNMPKGHSTPEELKVFLSSVKSELSDPRNRNK